MNIEEAAMIWLPIAAHRDDSVGVIPAFQPQELRNG